MSRLNFQVNTGIFLLACTALACGSQLVEFSLQGDGGLDGGSSDAPMGDGSKTDSGDRDVNVLDAAADSDALTNEAGLAPVVISTTPLNVALNVSINKRPTATFNEPMDPLSIIVGNFSLKQGVNSVPFTVSLDAQTNTAILVPTTPLGVNLPYTVTVTTGVKSLGGIPMAANFTWTFSTAACSQGPVALGSSGSFVILAGSTVTSTGPTSLTGDMGVSPGTAITGFPPGTIVGNQHAGDPTAATAIADLTTAYNAAAGRTLCPITVAGNIGGQTLAPGLYKSTSSLAVSSGDLTLDAQGDGDQVFIFQIASTLTTTPGRKVILAGGAKSSNVYWQVGTSATLDTTTDFQGTIMADQAITLNNKATLNGRALARIGAVVLDTNTVVKPTP